MRFRHRSLSLIASTLCPTVAAIFVLSPWRRVVSSSAAKLGSVGKFQGLRLGLKNGAGAVHACGELLARRDDEAERF